MKTRSGWKLSEIVEAGGHVLAGACIVLGWSTGIFLFFPAANFCTAIALAASL